MNLVDQMSPEAQSSDESDGEINSQKTYSIRRLVWRAPIVAHWLRTMDEYGSLKKKSSGGRWTAGNAPRI